jgi:hypothetical protein
MTKTTEPNPHELSRLFSYYVANQDEIVELFNGRHVVIYDCGVVADFDSALDAYQYAMEHYTPGEFMLQHVGAGEDNYTQRFYSPIVSFPQYL